MPMAFRGAAVALLLIPLLVAGERTAAGRPATAAPGCTYSPATAHESFTTSGDRAVLHRPGRVVHCLRAGTETVHLTVRVLGWDVPESGGSLSTAINLQTGEETQFGIANSGDGMVDVPPGRYGIGTLFGDPASRLTIAYQPDLSLTQDATVVVDARGARPVSVKVDNPAVQLVMTDPYLIQHTAAGSVQWPDWRPEIPDPAHTPIYVAATPPTSDLDFYVSTAWAPDGAATYVYNLLSGSHGLPAVPRWQVQTRDLAAVRTTYAAQGKTASATAASVPLPPVDDLINSSTLQIHVTTVPLPSVRTEYGPPGVWDGALNLAGSGLELLSGRSRYPAPGRYERHWMGSPATPQFLNPGYRVGDDIYVGASLYSDSDGDDLVVPPVDNVSGRTTVARGRDLIASSDRPGAIAATLRPESDVYTLTSVADRQASYSAYDTSEAITWTFRSAHVDYANLPLLTVGYHVALDCYGRAQAGRPTTLDVWLRPTPDTAAVPATDSLAVRVSYDDGRTWHPLALTGRGPHRHATLVPPRSAKYVSLAAEGRDADGNTVAERLIRAFGVLESGHSPSARASQKESS